MELITRYQNKISPTKISLQQRLGHFAADKLFFPWSPWLPHKTSFCSSVGRTATPVHDQENSSSR